MSATVRLRAVASADLPVFFAQQRDVEANALAGPPPRDPDDRVAFDTHWAKVLANPANTTRTIEADGAIAGYVPSFPSDGALEVCYWLGRDHWGCGIASAALRALLAEITARPLHARTMLHNAASRRVLEKNGFRFTHTAAARSRRTGEAFEEALFVLA